MVKKYNIQSIVYAVGCLLVFGLIPTVDGTAVEASTRKGSWHPKIKKEILDIASLEEVHIYLGTYPYSNQKLVVKNDGYQLKLTNPKIPGPVPIEEGKELPIGRLGMSMEHLLDSDHPSYETISRQHAVILKQGNKLIISDVGSKHGTSLHVFERKHGPSSKEQSLISTEDLLDKDFVDLYMGYIIDSQKLSSAEKRAVRNKFGAKLLEKRRELEGQDKPIRHMIMEDFFKEIGSFVSGLPSRKRSQPRL